MEDSLLGSIRYWVWFAGLSACGIYKDSGDSGQASGASASSAGFLALTDGTRCVVDDGDLKGFCGEGDSSFWGDASTEFSDAPCDISISATVWMSAATWSDGTAHTLGHHTDLNDHEATVWMTIGGQETASGSGTARANTNAHDEVRITFEIPELVDFLSSEATGMGASGEVLCTL